MAPPAPRRQVFLFLFRRFADGVEAIDRSIDVDRPLSSYGVGFDSTRFAAALGLPALTNLITVSRARGWSEQGVRWPHRRRADSFSPLRWRWS